MSVTVAGGLPANETRARGLPAAMKELRKHEAERGNQLMNLAMGKELEDEKPPYVFQQFPCMLYHAGGGKVPTNEVAIGEQITTVEPGRQIVVENKEALEWALKNQWRKQPFPSTPTLSAADQDARVRQLQRENSEKDAQIAGLTDVVSKFEERLNQLEKRG